MAEKVAEAAKTAVENKLEMEYLYDKADDVNARISELAAKDDEVEEKIMQIRTLNLVKRQSVAEQAKLKI